MNVQPYTFTIGHVACMVVQDGASILGIERLLRRFPDATEADYRHAYAEIGLRLDDAGSSFNILVMHMGDEVVLVDAGEGKPKGGDVTEGLRAAGVAPDDVTLVVITHADGDHVLGLLGDDGTPTFGRARYVIAREELRWWRERAERGATEHQAIIAMIERQGLREIAMDEQIGPGLRAVPLAGHTPGHIGVLLESEGERLLHLADLVHSPMQFGHPEWSPVFDHDTSLSVPARRAALGRAADDDILALFYHLTFPGLGRVRRTARGFRWEPLGGSRGCDFVTLSAAKSL